MKKEIEEDTNKWKCKMCSWIGRINIIKISILPKAIYRFKAILMQTPMVHCTYLEPIFQIYIWNQIIDLK